MSRFQLKWKSICLIKAIISVNVYACLALWRVSTVKHSKVNRVVLNFKSLNNQLFSHRWQWQNIIVDINKFFIRCDWSGWSNWKAHHIIQFSSTNRKMFAMVSTSLAKKETRSIFKKSKIQGIEHMRSALLSHSLRYTLDPCATNFWRSATEKGKNWHTNICSLICAWERRWKPVV